MSKSLRRCPNCIAPKGRDCPHWIGPEDGIIEVNDQTGEQRLYVGCSCGAFQARMARYIIQTNMRVAAAVEHHRDDILEALEKIETRRLKEAKLAKLFDSEVKNRLALFSPQKAPILESE